ncbi:hypothetical protein Tco_0883654 [Tanacetum coccineum]
MNEDKIKKDLEKIETINIELDHRVSKLVTENEHLKQTYKQLYDSIKLAHIRSKEQALKDDLRKLKGKTLVNNVVMKHTIDPETLKIDVEPITPKLLNIKTAYSAYIKHTREEAAILRDLVEYHSKLNVNSKLLCVKCNGCMLSDNHDLCVLDFINNVNARAKSKSVNKSFKEKRLGNQTKKVFTNIGYTWRPTSRTFSIVGNACPLTRITTTAEVPLRKPTALETDTHKPVVTLVYSRKPRKSKTHSSVVQIVLWNVTISRVYYVEGLGHNLFSVGQFCDSNLEVAFRQHTYFIRNLEEAVATTCYTQNRSVIRLHHGKTPYELLHDKLPDLSFLYLFGSLCYPINDSENLGKLQPKADIVMASEHNSSGPALHEITPATISSGLVPNPPPSTPFVPHSRTNWDLLFQPLFDELLNPSLSVDHQDPEVIPPIAEVVALEPVASTGSPSSTTVDQDAPSPSKSQTSTETQSPIISNDVEEENHVLEIAHMNNDPFFSIPIPENDSESSSSSDVIPTVVHNC